jgi:hypothetical protein
MAGQAKALNDMMDRYEVSKEAALAAMAAMAAAGNEPGSKSSAAQSASDRRSTHRPWAKTEKSAPAPKMRAVAAGGDGSEWKEF